MKSVCTFRRFRGTWWCGTMDGAGGRSFTTEPVPCLCRPFFPGRKGLRRLAVSMYI